MDTIEVNGVELEYDVAGSGEPVLLVSPMLADGFVPLANEPTLADRYQLIRYHRRGWVGSTHSLPPVSIEDHAADAAALLEGLGLARAHVVGHSSGGAIGVQVALDRPEVVHTLSLFELSVLSVPSAPAFLEKAGPAIHAYQAGDHEEAVAIFLSAVSGADWGTCRAVIEGTIPGQVAQTIKDADTFFGIELPSLSEWTFTEEVGSRLTQPVLSVLGTETHQMWVEVAELIRASAHDVEECVIDGVSHLLHVERPEPVARGLDAFLARHPMTA